MKRSISLLILLFCFIPPIMNYWPYKPPPRPEFHPDCKRMNKTQPLNYLGTNLTLTKEDDINLLLCPGDAIGDLTATYVKIQDCNLTMYHKDKIIWSKGRGDSLISKGKCSNYDYCFCVFSLKRDGNLVLHQSEIYYSHEGNSDWSKMDGWKTYYYLTKTELKVKDQQLQIIRIFSDGTQRLFYLDENNQGFTEDMGKPIKKADKFIVKNHSDRDKTILRRNEYIGDLNGTHLILQPNCKLQLLNKNSTIWSLIPFSSHDETLCDLNVAQDNNIAVSGRWMDGAKGEYSVMESEPNLKVVESKITFSDSEPIIIQTLKNGSELIFYGGRLKRELKQIAQGTWKIPRMGYVGDLTGLHLILEHNCSLMLVNGDEKLWEFQRGPQDSSDAATGCSLELESSSILLKSSHYRWEDLLGDSSLDRELTTGYDMTLENDQIVVKRKRRDRVQPDIFYAGRQTNGTFYQFIAQNSIVVNHTSSYVEILPRMGYIGDLNGVYALLDQNCNLVLYNKTQLLWESGAFLDQTSIPWDPCGLGMGLHDDMQAKISALTNRYNDREAIWSAMDFRPHGNLGQILKAELSIIHNELWITYTFQDGTVNREKASQGTNHFTNNLAQFQPPPHTDEEKMVSCIERNATQPLNYRGTNLTSNNNDLQDVVLCLGDAFGDLNETYVTLEFCSLTMYHKDKRIWSSNAHWPLPYSEDCVFSLERDGNLVFYVEGEIYPDPGDPYSVPYRAWDSQTNFNPVKTELMIQNQQVKMIQTFGDGTQRIFYGDANHQEFREHLGGPTKVADKFIIKSHQDQDKTVLRRNEYIGDLKGTHLILQTNCQLQLLTKNKIIWSFIPPIRHAMNCALNIAQDGTIEISRVLPDIKVGSFYKEQRVNNYESDRESLIKHPEPLRVIESKITFEGDQPMIIQTLKNGAKLTFCGMPGQNSGLSPKNELTQIASKTIILRNEVFLKRMDYIGNLTGLHLILEQNCSLILANGNKKLWELQSESYSTDDPLMDCSVTFLYRYGEIALTKEFKRVHHQRHQHLVKYYDFSERDEADITEVQLTLENDQIIVKKERSQGRPDIFYAGPKTNGSFFEFLAERSVIINLARSSQEILPKMGYIGDLNGVYTIIDQKCNWILYNKTKVLWESGTYLESGACSLYQWDDGELMMTREREPRWSAFDSSAHKGFFNKLLSVEVLVNNDGLWLIYTFRDGAIHKYKAITGTNHFGLVLKEYEKSFGLEL